MKIVPGKSEIFKNISTKMHMKYNWYKNRIKNFLESYKVFNQQQKPIVPPVELDFIRRAAGDLDDKIANTESTFNHHHFYIILAYSFKNYRIQIYFANGILK